MKPGKILLAAGLLISLNVEAALYDRGNGMLYDNVLNITWLKDANYAKTSGYDADGLMTWTQAKTWADDLVHAGFSDWRLANVTPINGIFFDYVYSSDGSSDRGYNITSPNSELSYMYYVNLELKGYYNSSGINQSNFGVFGNGTQGGQADVGLVENLQSGSYWSSTGYGTDAGTAWGFDTKNGFQQGHSKGIETSAWAVRDGDVTAVPIPGAVWLFGSAILGFAGLKHRKS